MTMAVIHPILADTSAGISELKKDPMEVLRQSNGAPVVIINRDQPVFYVVPTAAYEALLDKLDDIELAEIVKARKDQKEIEVDLGDQEDSV
jgi:antitoxin StbD